MSLERGTLLNKRYRIVEILGQGGMGSVYRAVDENLGVDLAVKENLFTTDEYARQFRREATLLASLRHPNLPRVTDHFEVDNRGQYLIMDYIEGEDLRQRMDRDGRIPEEDVIVIGIAICEALNYLHTRKPQVVHRDIKPGNVKIAPDGRIFLVDFGLAKVVEGTQATTTGARAMTPGYSPPEQYGTARTDNRSDLYSLGATLYAALCGVLPEDGLARAMEQTDLTPIKKYNPKVSRRLASVIEKALAVQPDARFQSAEEFKQALIGAANNNTRKAGGDLTITPPPAVEEQEEDLEANSNGSASRSASAQVDLAEEDSQGALRTLNKPQDQELLQPRSRPRKKRSSGYWLTSIVIVIFLAVGSALVYAALPAVRGAVNQSLGSFIPGFLPGSQNTPLPEGGLGSLSETPTSTPTITLEPTATERVEPTPTSSATPTATLQPTSLPTDAPTPEPPFLGNSNGEVAYVSDRTGLPQIYIINVDGVRFRQITDMPQGACQPDWSPDGLQLVFIAPCPDRRDLYLGATLFTIKPDGSDLRQLLGSAAGDYDPDWSPDGTKIAFTSLRGTGRPQVYVLNLDDVSITPLATEGLKNQQPAWSPDSTQIAYISTLENGERLWIMNADGSEKRALSDVEGIASRPKFTPDSASLVYTYRENLGALPKIYWTPVDEFSPVKIGADDAPRREANISPDGLWLVVESWPTGNNHDIYILSLVGDESRILVGLPFYEFSPAWRPYISQP